MAIESRQNRSQAQLPLHPNRPTSNNGAHGSVAQISRYDTAREAILAQGQPGEISTHAYDSRESESSQGRTLAALSATIEATTR